MIGIMIPGVHLHYVWFWTLKTVSASFPMHRVSVYFNVTMYLALLMHVKRNVLLCTDFFLWHSNQKV